jgi:RHH-type transcriptional regulator, proline utilization regulon repressor / proline dehydrogenase / delta 1-pyrroline-5-carboxylate dehydrogenase
VTGLSAEANLLRHRPHERVVLRVGAGVAARDVARVLVAAERCSTPVTLSRAASTTTDATITVAEELAGDGAVASVSIVETEAELAARIAAAGQVVVRALGASTAELRRACEEAGVRIVTARPVMSAQVELGRLLREQAVSRTLHRYGRVVG